MHYINEYLNKVKTECRYRSLSEYQPLDAVHVMHEDQVCLLMASNNYLGLTHHPAVRQAAVEAMLAYGAGSGGARLTTGTHPLFSRLEKDLAAFKQREAALVFNTGYMANVGVISALAGPGDVIFSDELNHASIIDGCRLSRARTVVYRHADPKHLRECLETVTCAGQKLIITDGVFSMDGDIAPLDQIVDLAECHQAMVLLDDAHATGVIGPGGKGTAAAFGLKGRVHVEIGTLSKALAAEGGYVAADRNVIEYLVNRARSFIFSTALAPSTVAAAGAALEVLADNPGLVESLGKNAAFLRRRLHQAGFAVENATTPIIPVVVGDETVAMQLAQELKTRGIIVSAIRPPSVPQGASRLRITVTAAHQEAELEHVVEALRSIKDNPGEGGN